jgi:hypothetical protein
VEVAAKQGLVVQLARTILVAVQVDRVEGLVTQRVSLKQHQHAQVVHLEAPVR